MVRAACHCGAVRLVLDRPPGSVTDCNCTICRRYGALWAYTRFVVGERGVDASLLQGADTLDAYVWGVGEYRLNRCRQCGCVTHVSMVEDPDRIFAVNARNFVAFDPDQVTLRRWDNAETGRFWTRPDAPIVKGVHPPIPPPDPESWR